MPGGCANHYTGFPAASLGDLLGAGQPSGPYDDQSLSLKLTSTNNALLQHILSAPLIIIIIIIILI